MTMLLLAVPLVPITVSGPNPIFAGRTLICVALMY